MAKKEKTVSYRRAEWLNDNPGGLTLEGCLREALKKLKTVSDRTIISGGQLTSVAKTKDGSSGGLLLHLVVETPGESASVVPKVAPTTAAYDLFKKAALRSDSTRFELMKAADVTKIKMLQSQGVKEIELHATMYKASLDYAKRTSNVVGVLGSAARQIKALLKKPNDYTQDGLRIALTLKTDARYTKAISLGEKRINELGLDILRNHEEGDDDFSILTKTGQRITPTEIFMRRKVSVEGEGKTVKLDKIWKELTTFYSLLVKSGAVEQ